MKLGKQVILFLEQLETHGFVGVRIAKSYLRKNGLSLESDDVDYIHHRLLSNADKGDSRAMYALAECYLRGVFGYMDTAEAYRWCSAASEGKYAPAMVMLAGFRIEDQSFADADLHEAIRLLKRAVDLGYGPAACHLGISYLTGSILPRNPDLARSYFAKGAELGDAGSMFHLASILLEDGGESDRHWALELLERAAESNQLEAIFSLISIHREGRYGLKEDAERAAYYDAKYDVVARSLSYKIDTSSFLRPRPK